MGGVNEFDRVAKLNEMTKSLKAHGFAEDTLSAIEQAEEIYPEYGGGKGAKPGTQPATQAAASVQAPAQSKDGGATKESYEQLATYLKINEDFKKDVQDKIKNLGDQVGKVVEKMNEMIKTINEIEGKVNAIARAPAPRPAMREEPREEAPRQREAESEERQVTSAPQKEPDRRSAPEPEPHHEGTTRKDGEYANQRTGAYQPGDVSIEKMFYMGKK